MKTGMLAGAFLAALAFIGTPLPAQEVSAEVHVRGGPVAGRVIVGDRFVERYPPRVIVVERVRQHHRRPWRRNGYRPVVVYYVDGRYYERIGRRHSRVREVVVYEHRGRYYRDDRTHGRDD